MLSIPDIRDILSRVTYKPGSRIDIQLDFEQDTPTLVVDLPVQDAYTLQPAKIGTRRVIPKHYLKSRESLLSYIFMTVEGIEKHEVREWLKYDRMTVIDPHPEEVPSWIEQLMKRIL